MADTSPKDTGGDAPRDEVLGIGWHLKQGEQLCAAYAKAAEEAGEEKWSSFFRDMATSYERLLAEGTDRLRELTGADPATEGWGWWCRPPW